MDSNHTPDSSDRRISITDGSYVLPQLGSTIIGEGTHHPTTAPTFSQPETQQNQEVQTTNQATETDFSNQETTQLETQVVTLVTGESVVVVLKPQLSGKHFFIYQGKVRQLGQTTADNWLIMERVYTINGLAPTLELLTNDNGLDGDQRSAVDKAVHSNLTPIDADEVALPDGRILTRRKLKPAEYMSFKSQLGQNPTHAFRFAVLQSFSIDGEPVKMTDFEDPNRVDFDLASVMVLRLAQIFGMGV